MWNAIYKIALDPQWVNHKDVQVYIRWRPEKVNKNLKKFTGLCIWAIKIYKILLI